MIDDRANSREPGEERIRMKQTDTPMFIRIPPEEVERMKRRIAEKRRP